MNDDEFATRWPRLPKAIGSPAQPVTTYNWQKQIALEHINKAMAALLAPIRGDYSCEYEIVQDLGAVAKHLQARIK